MNIVQKLRQLTDGLRAAGPSAKTADWELAGRLLTRVPADQAAAAKAVADRDVEALDAVVTRLEQPEAPAEPAAEDPPVSEEEMTRALKAFRKRLKVTRLAEESKLGGRYTSGGRKSEVYAMQPPAEFPPHVWRALVKAGKLRDTGRGFYAEA